MRRSCIISLSTAVVVSAAGLAWAGATIQIDETSTVELGLWVQPMLVVTEEDGDGDGVFETDTRVRARRGRLRLKGTLAEWVTALVQTDVASPAGGAGYDMRVIDAWVALKAHDWLAVYAGEHMSPASRENVTAALAMMTIDRPGMTLKTLTWGTRSGYGFINGTYGDSDAGLRGDLSVRDSGVTLFGSSSVSDGVHLKYYAGAYDGIHVNAADDLRFTGRVQMNLLDAEPGYFNLSTYLGGKKTVGIGASYDTQADVATCENKGDVDYRFYTLDAFAEFPAGPGSVTLEAAFESLDLGGATALDHDGDALTPGKNATQAEGAGFYVQAGYFVSNWQPWVEYEHWESDAADDKGTYDMYRIGLTYYIKGHNANIKAGYERLDADAPIGSTTEDSINSFVMGCYVTY